MNHFCYFYYIIYYYLLFIIYYYIYYLNLLAVNTDVIVFKTNTFILWAWKAQVAVRMLHRTLLQAAWLSCLWAVQVSSCPEVCSKCSGPENDQCEECRAGWTLHNNTCVGTVHKICSWTWKRSYSCVQGDMTWQVTSAFPFFFLDFDECGSELGICSPNSFCFNTEGSYECRGA